MLSTPLCEMLGVRYPVLLAGMGGGISGPDLAAAVSNAGGFGVIGGLGLPAPVLAQMIAATRQLTAKPFGVNLVIPLMQGGEVEVCLAARVPLLVFFWGDPQPYVAEAHKRGTKIVMQVGSADEAKAAAAAGVDAIIAQGVEAGGHVRSTTSLSTLLPTVVDAVQPLPVIAAGGIATGRGLAAALALGAQAASIGTRFLCSQEACADDAYKQRVVRSRAEDTVYTTLFDIGWPDAAHRVLRNKAIAEWEAAGHPRSGQRPGEGQRIGTVPLAGVTLDVPRYSAMPPMPGFQGDLDCAVMYCGESCSLIHDIKPAAAIVRDLMREAEAVIAQRV
jgi:nitronate monooxygenase